MEAGGDHDPTEAKHAADHETSDETSDDRDRIGADRDDDSVAHEIEAQARDDRADARDDIAAVRDRAIVQFVAAAASDRAEALRDRQDAAGDRARAGADRAAASSDRVVAAGERAVSSIDGLTGAHRRDAGTVELRREIARAKRTGQSFVLAFVDVDDLKTTNDSHGHAAGDQVLRQIVDAIRANLRAYDLIVRFGGDEFVCGLPDLTMADAIARFSLVSETVAKTPQASFTVGLAALNPDDSLEDLIARADDALYQHRQPRPT